MVLIHFSNVFFCLLFMCCSAQEFCSVGDDSCLILWDTRAGSSPVVKVLYSLSLSLYMCASIVLEVIFI